MEMFLVKSPNEAWYITENAPLEGSFKRFKVNFNNTRIAPSWVFPAPKIGDVLSIDGKDGCYELISEVPILWAVVKTNAASGEHISIFNTHHSKKVCESIAANCNKFAELGQHYIVKQL